MSRNKGLLSLPSELLHEIIQICRQHERCRLRATCKTLKEHADPIVFRRIRLHHRDSPYITEHQIIALATQSSRACELTKDMDVYFIPSNLRPTEQSWPHFGHCEDLRIHLPTAISSLRNLTRFRLSIAGGEPAWIIESLMQAVARLPRLTDLVVRTSYVSNVLVPLALFSNLSELSVECGRHKIISSFVSQMSTVIANSPQLRCLSVTFGGFSFYSPLPTLSDLFAKLSAKNPLRLERLHISYMDATVDQVTLPHLTNLTSFRFQVRYQDLTVARNVWTSFLVNNVKLSEVNIGGIVTKETMSYLSSLLGLKGLALGSLFPPPDMTLENLKNVFFEEILPKHVGSLEALDIVCGQWAFNTNSESIMKCHKLRHLRVVLDGDTPLQQLLDTVAHLAELKILRIVTIGELRRWDELANFKPIRGLRYVEKLEICGTLYVLERDGERPVRYQEIR